MKNILFILFAIIATSCSRDPENINYGSDNCSFCKMTIMDDKFSAECISTKGKTFKFDDMLCLHSFIKNGGIWSNEIAKIYLADYSNKGKWIEADKAFIIHSEALKSPMNGNYAAFNSEEQREAANRQLNGEKLLWNQVHSGK